jgi:ERCC4-related helicase
MRDVVLLVLDECHHATKKRVARARVTRAVTRLQHAQRAAATRP